MFIELTKFKVKNGKSKKVDEWLTFLNEHMESVLLTLEDEKMFVETIFREKDGDQEYLYWYSIQDSDGQSVEDSNHWVDKKHLEYWNECIDQASKPIDLTPSVTMIPAKIKDSMT
ncbi:DUF6176 family protein [Alkalibacillus salilacus]|uniref:Uncharacterized protein n=1 Tax=Alkalibacillus salilacus TaxID=284582 RepID=A0ABT9VHC4_9BACI|nr:DUF6176 family protein [Alkalibacillus salilacus]MDQ0160357.1 hypothetical protein [Alkalibacillus salilacus]